MVVTEEFFQRCFSHKGKPLNLMAICWETLRYGWWAAANGFDAACAGPAQPRNVTALSSSGLREYCFNCNADITK